jgi:benzoyl-CoA reductase/2-hydroxyglutaryl-CoA dehydratase subunit BcrC/BadD/HgdB
MNNFKAKVLDLAVAQIDEHTDITVTYEQIKKGRKITGFLFKFKQKAKPIEQAKPQPSKGSNPLSGVKDWEVFYQKHKLNAAESMDEFSKRIRKEAAEGTFSLSPTD